MKAWRFYSMSTSKHFYISRSYILVLNRSNKKVSVDTTPTHHLLSWPLVLSAVSLLVEESQQVVVPRQLINEICNSMDINAHGKEKIDILILIFLARKYQVLPYVSYAGKPSPFIYLFMLPLFLKSLRKM